MIRRPPRSTLSSSSAASDVYKRQGSYPELGSTCESGPSPFGSPLKALPSLWPPARLCCRRRQCPPDEVPASDREVLACRDFVSFGQELPKPCQATNSEQESP